MAIAKIILLTIKKRSGGQHPIVLRVTHDRKRRYTTLGESYSGYMATTEQWDSERCRLRKNHPDHKTINPLLAYFEKKACDILLSFENEHVDFTFDRFNKEFRREKPKDDLSEIFDEEIARLTKEGRIGYAQTYQSTKQAIIKYAVKTDLKLREIDYKFLAGFKGSLVQAGDKDTTISVYLRTFRTLFNSAIRYGYIKEQYYPFFNARSHPNGYSLGDLNTKTRPRAISKEQLFKIRDLQLKEDTTIFHDRNYFMFSYYCRGINFHDMAHLKWKDIENGRLYYVRSKTKGKLDVKLLPPALEIIAYYKEYHSSPYIFPILQPGVKDLSVIHARKRNALKRLNKNLKKIATKVELDVKGLSSYVSRHTYATVLRDAGTPAEIISESMDHQDTRQTMTYLASLDKKIVDEANAALL